jgi:hypothetical protein
MRSKPPPVRPIGSPYLRRPKGRHRRLRAATGRWPAENFRSDNGLPGLFPQPRVSARRKPGGGLPPGTEERVTPLARSWRSSGGPTVPDTGICRGNAQTREMSSCSAISSLDVYALTYPPAVLSRSIAIRSSRLVRRRLINMGLHPVSSLVGGDRFEPPTPAL